MLNSAGLSSQRWVRGEIEIPLPDLSRDPLNVCVHVCVYKTTHSQSHMGDDLKFVSISA